MSPKFVWVHWGDAWGNSSQYYREGADYAPVRATTPGWLMEDNEETLVIAKTQFEDDSYRDLTVIPKSWVISIDYLDEDE